MAPPDPIADDGSVRPPFLAIALVSAAALGYEILLLRLFSIIQWQHFAYMIISLALFGYGVSGTFLALAGDLIGRRFGRLFAANAALFGVAAPGCFFLAQRVPFNPLELLWDPLQPLYLAALYLLLAVPFLFAANCIGLAFCRFRGRIGKVYASDLLGAGTGALGMVALLFALTPMEALNAIGAAGFAAAALSLVARGADGRRRAMALLSAGLAFLLVLSGPWVELRLSPYKGLSQALRVSGAEIAQELSGPLGLVTVVKSPRVPFRHAPGLSLRSPFEPPEQLGVFTDGGSFGVINRDDGREAPPGYLDYLTSALPYHLLEKPRVLVLGAGGGGDVQLALYHRASRIDAVEANYQMVALLEDDYASFSGRLYGRPGVRVHIAEIRGFVAAGGESYDLIQLALVDAFGAASAGLSALNENYLYTVEAMEDFLARLAPGGLVAITRWLKLPPRDSLKLLATAAQALRRSGAADPSRRLVLIRGWKTTTLLIKNGAFSEPEIAAVKRFADARSFDLAYIPGITPGMANRYNLLDRAYFHDAATAILGPSGDDFIRRYKYDIRPATDDRPYFFNFFRWRLLGEFYALRGRGGFGLLEWGYPVLALTLAQAVLITLALIPLTLLAVRARHGGAGGARKIPVLVYFLSLGLAFLFVEIAFIQKFILFLASPVYAAAVVLCGFLVFAGLGSRVSGRLLSHANPSLAPVVAIGFFAVAYLFLLTPLFEELIMLPLAGKMAVSLLLIAPLAFAMGMLFPLGLRRLGEAQPGLIPWAWAINGCASMLGAVLATVVAIQFGFTVVILAAVGFYGIAVAAFRRFPGAAEPLNR